MIHVQAVYDGLGVVSESESIAGLVDGRGSRRYAADNRGSSTSAKRGCEQPRELALPEGRVMSVGATVAEAFEHSTKHKQGAVDIGALAQTGAFGAGFSNALAASEINKVHVSAVRQGKLDDEVGAGAALVHQVTASGAAGLDRVKKALEVV
jgi:hypothetical protein